MGLVTLPMVTANARESSMSLGEILCALARWRTSGVPIIAIVSFIKRADASPMKTMTRRTRESTERVRLNRAQDMREMYPLSSSACPTTNIPKRKSMTSRFIESAASTGEI